ncbi:MAG: LacI family DNA-binding transcriptional regulator [Steroidobacteraceae bacterium]
MARRIGVSIATVSRALNPRTAHLVSARTRARVRAAATEMDYRPNVLATALAGAETHVVGVLTSEFRSGHTAALLGALQDELCLQDYWPMLAGTSSWRESRHAAFNALISRKVDGLVVLPALSKDPVVDEIIQRGIPAVVAYGRSGCPTIPSITVDDKAAMHDIVRYLAGLGHRKLICVTGPRQVHAAESRTSAFLHACKARRGDGLSFNVVETEGFGQETAASAVTTLLAMRNVPTAIVAVSDTLALGCIDELERRGVAVPREFSVVGFGDIPMMSRLTCPLTTIAVPAARIGREAGRCLLSLLAGEPHDDVLLRAQLVVRKSTDVPRAAGVQPRQEVDSE